MTNLILADFHGLSIEVVDHAGKKWLTAEQVGRALGYNQHNARAGINNLYNRHADEFTDDDTCVINLMTQTQDRAIRVFSATGCNLLSFFSSTPRAKEFRAWAKAVLTGQAAVSPAPTSVEGRLDRLEQATVKLAGHMAQLVEVSYQQAQKLDVTARYIGLLEINQKGRVRVTRTVEAQVLALTAQGMPQRDISRLVRVSPATVNLLIHGKYQFAASEAVLPPESVETILERLIDKERAAIAQQAEGGAA